MIPGYDFTTAEKREETANLLFAKARNARQAQEREWEKCNDYYNFVHDSVNEVKKYCEDKGLPWVPACIPDPYIIVESQIDPDVPEPEFRGRDDDVDGKMAKQREYAVRYICQRNRLKDMNTANERRCIKLGDCFWKAYFDINMRMGVAEGDIRVVDVPVEAIYPDPAAGNRGLQAGQYLFHLYRIHKVEFAQTYGRALQKLGLRPEELFGQDYDRGVEEIFDMTTALDEDDDTVQIMELWFKQPEDRDGVEAGRVACTIQAGGREVKYIPDYWQNTGEQCKLFPFVHAWRIRDENSFWNKSELFPVLDLVDAADRKLATALLNEAFMANDIVLVEEGAMAEGCVPTNEPGAVWSMKPNKVGAVARLGGLQSGINATGLINWLGEQIQRTNRNFDSNLGRETTRQTTATALALQREDADNQSSIKKADRTAGFERLYELLDWLALEFYDDDRMIFLGAKEKGEKPVQLIFNSQNLVGELPAVTDLEGNVVRPAKPYYPVIDVTVNAGEGVIKGKRATLEVLDKLVATPVTAENWKLLAAELEILEIPQKQEIVAEWERRFAAPAASEQQLTTPFPPLGKTALDAAVLP